LMKLYPDACTHTCPHTRTLTHTEKPTHTHVVKAKAVCTQFDFYYFS